MPALEQLLPKVLPGTPVLAVLPTPPVSQLPLVALLHVLLLALLLLLSLLAVSDKASAFAGACDINVRRLGRLIARMRRLPFARRSCALALAKLARRTASVLP